MAKDNDGLLISAGLDIQPTLKNIKDDIEKKLNPELKNDKNTRARIVGGLNIAETTRLINANLATISKGLKLDIGNVGLTNSGAGLNNSIKIIQDKISSSVKETARARQTNVQATDKEVAATERLLNKQSALIKQFEIQQSKYSKIGKEMDSVQVDKFTANISNLNAESLEKAAHAVQQIRLDFSLLNAKTVADIPQNAIENMQKNLKLMSPTLDELSSKMSKMSVPSSDLSNRITEIKNKLAEANNIDVKKDNGLEKQIGLYNSIKVEVQAITKELNAQIRTEKSVKDEIEKTLGKLQSTKGNSVFKKNSSNVDVQVSITKLNELQAKYLQFQQALATAKSPEEIQKLSAELTQIKPQFDFVVASAKNLQASLKDTNGADALAQKIRVLKTQIEQYMAANTKAIKSNKILSTGNTVTVELNNMIAALNDASSPEEYQKIASNFRIIRNEVKRLGIEGKTLWGTLKANAAKFTQWMGLTGSTTRVFMYLRQTLTTIKEVDTELTEISKTANVTRESLEDLGLTSYDAASKYGKLATDYLQGIKEMTRAGFEGKASEDMAELSILAQAAGDMTAELGNEYLIATNAAYKLEGNTKKLNAVLDGQNYVTNHNALNMTELAEATKIAGSQASSSGVQVDELTAAVGTMIATTRQGGDIAGRAFKGILMNLQQVKATADEIGDNGEDITDESLTKYEKACADLGVALKEVKDGIWVLRNPMEVLNELAVAFNKEADDSIKKANLINAVGGKYRGNQLDTLLKNWSTYKKMLSEFNSSEAQGSALREAEKSAQSLDGRLNSLKNSLAELVNKFISSDFLKGLVDDGGKLIDTLNEATPLLKGIFDILGGGVGVVTDIVKQIGLLPTIFAGLSLKNVGKLIKTRPLMYYHTICA